MSGGHLFRERIHDGLTASLCRFSRPASRIRRKACGGRDRCLSTLPEHQTLRAEPLRERAGHPESDQSTLDTKVGYTAVLRLVAHRPP